MVYKGNYSNNASLLKRPLWKTFVEKPLISVFTAVINKLGGALFFHLQVEKHNWDGIGSSDRTQLV